MDMTFTARQILEKCREQHRDLYAIFVDLTKAFDTVNRKGPWMMLRRIGCPDKFVKIIESFHEVKVNSLMTVRYLNPSRYQMELNKAAS